MTRIRIHREADGAEQVNAKPPKICNFCRGGFCFDCMKGDCQCPCNSKSENKGQGD